MVYSIQVAVKEGTSTTIKGQLLEDLCAEILRAQQFTVTERVRVTGIEIDLLAVHNVSGEKIIVECKAWEDNLSADAITKLLGNVTFRKVSAGWLVSTGDLGKDAEGLKIEWESRSVEERRILSFYTKERIIQLLIANAVIMDSASFNYNLASEYKLSDSHTLLITEYGRFWLVPVIAVTAGIPIGVLVFDAKTGDRISDASIINDLKQTKNSFKELEWIIEEASSISTTRLVEEELQNIVTVISGDDWNDYRPSRPKDFVGRINIINDIFSFLKSVINSNTDTRLFAIKSPSGWGKSSVILKIVDAAKSRRKSRSYYIYAVDVRTALSSRYAELSFKACLDAAVKDNFLKLPSTNVNINNVINILNDETIKPLFKQLKEDNKLIVIIFDQFEETFSKKELSTLFDSIKKLSFAVDSQKENIVLGFAWKTDLSIPADHSAYHMWNALSDRRKEFELLKFTSGEISSAINVFGKQLGEQVNPILKRYLTEQCQGYPWLLKKLCIHVHSLITSGIDQGDIIGQRLSINDLFEKDLNELTPSEAGCITEVAKDSPADFFKITELYGNDTVQLLINKRLLIRSASKLILYWDIFRDYVLYKVVPPIVLSYIPLMQYNAIMRVVNVLLKNNNLTSDQVALETELQKSTIDNIMIDMVMFGIAQRKKDKILLLMSTKKDILGCLMEIFKNHLIYKLIQQSISDTFNYEIYSNIFMDTYAQINVKKKTKLSYSAKLFSWFRALNLFIEAGAEYRLNENTEAGELGQEVVGYTNRRGNSYRRDSHFLGQTSPDKVAKTIKLIESGINTRSEIKKLGFRNALEASLSLIDTNNGFVLLRGTYNDVIRKASLSFTIKSCFELLSTNPELNAIEVGEYIEKRLLKKWSDASKRRHGAALLLWCRYLTLIN